jgi:hypothetical protein
MDLPGIDLGYELADALKAIQAQVAYDIPDIGTVTLTYQNTYKWWLNNTGWGAEERRHNPDTAGAIGLTFISYSLVPGLAFEVGGNYNLSDEDVPLRQAVDPVRIGFGFHYTGGDGNWGVKNRSAIRLHEEDPMFRFDVMPWYNFGFATLFCDFRVLINPRINSDRTENTLGWHVNPYLRKDFGGGSQMRFGGYFGDRGNGDVDWFMATSFLFAF